MLQYWFIHRPGASQVVPVVNNLPANSGDTGELGSILESGRSPGEGNGNPLQYSYLENPMDRGAWLTLVHRVAKRWTKLWLSGEQLILIKRKHSIMRECLWAAYDQTRQVYNLCVCVCVCMCAKSLLFCPTLCDPMCCSPPASSVHGILQVRILE